MLFGAENFEALADQVAAVLRAKDSNLDIDVDRYRKLAAAGVLRVFTVRDGDELLGFVIFTLGMHPHHRAELWGFANLLWISEVDAWANFEGRPLAVHLLAHAERLLQREGIVALSATADADEESHYIALGYEPCGVLFQARTAPILDS